MQHINKILKLLGKYFIKPFLISVGSTFLIIGIFKLRIQPLTTDVIVYAELTISLILFYRWFTPVNKENRFKKLITTSAPSFFLVNIFLSILISIGNVNNYIFLQKLNIIIGFLLAASYIVIQNTRQTELYEEPNNNAKRDKWYKLIFIIILVIGIFLIGHRILNIKTINVDEAHSSIASYGILQTGLPYFPNSQAIYGRSWLHLYLVAGSYLIFGFNEVAGRIPSLIFYILTVIIFNKLLKRFISRDMALLFTFIFSINPWMLHFGSIVRMYILLAFFTLLYLYIFIDYIENKTSRSLFLYLPITLFCGIFTERSFLIFGIPYLMVFFKEIFSYRKRIFKIPYIYTIIILILSLFCFVIIKNIAYIQEFISRYVIGFNEGSIFSNLKLQFAPLQWLISYSFSLIILILSAIGIRYSSDKRIKWLLFIFIVGEILVDLLVYSNFPTKRDNYSFILFPMYFILIAYGITKVSLLLTKKSQKVLFFIPLVAVLIFSTKDRYTQIPYADFSIIKSIPNGVIIAGYPTSPIIFYNIKYNRSDKIYPFIDDSVEISKYVQNEKEIYSGNKFITGIDDLNKLRNGNDVYLLYEKTRLDFLSVEVKEYIFKNCKSITPKNAVAVNKIIEDNYKFSHDDYVALNETILLKCPTLTK